MYSQLFPHQFCWTLHSRHVHCNIHIFDHRHKLRTGTISIEDLSNSILLQILQCFPLWEGSTYCGILPPSAPITSHALVKAPPVRRKTQSIYIISYILYHMKETNTIYIYHIIFHISYGRKKHNLYDQFCL